MDASLINREFDGFTAVLRLTFEGYANASAYTLVLELGESHTAGAQALSVQFIDVGQLSLSHFGGGLTQLLCLRAKYVGDKQLDRVTYEVADLERNSITFTCRTFDVIRRYYVGDGVP